jgi:hypothetical protein
MTTQLPRVSGAMVTSLMGHFVSPEEKLHTTTWHNHTAFMIMWFRGVGASYIAEGKEAVPADCIDLDASLQTHLYNITHKDFAQLVSEESTTLAAWKALKTRFASSTMTTRIEARTSFYKVQHDPSKPIDVYIKAIEKAVKILEGLGCKPDDTHVGDILLMNLHDSWKNIRQNLMSGETEPLLAAIKKRLINSAPGISSSDMVSVKVEEDESHIGESLLHAANATRFSGHSNAQGPNSNNWRSRDSSDPRKDKEFRWCDPTNENHCHRCGRSGHIAARCMYDMPQRVKDWIMANPWRTDTSQPKTEQAHTTFVSHVSHSPSHSRSPSPSYSRPLSPCSDFDIRLI